MNRRDIEIPVVEVTAPQCQTCGKRVGAIKYDDDGRRYRDCDCTRAARLKAAAPDLLDALTALTRRVQLANDEGDPIASALVPDCLAAIAKATGEQP